MTFADSETKDLWQHTDALLKTVVAYVEGVCFRFGYQIEVIQCDIKCAYIGIPHSDENHYAEIISQINTTFKRADKLSTCITENAEHRIITIITTSVSDFTSYH